MSKTNEYSYDLFRHELLPELLGEDEEIILYWAGKALARKKHEEIETDGLATFFEKASFGALTLLKEKRSERIYELTTNDYQPKRPFSLEAGFLAQLTELEMDLLAEATYEVKKKKPTCLHITVRWDKKDPSSMREDA
ncbi:DUF2507 domain-containing protein [Paenalkalicoccus suaedae]|uniref:DUF2507 domain-containing protein n=1 Tax=Paenalkalicoccus suaedae TaxID=2592382 RepID=A0A859FG32_9BACI|nr:DUF2507 domain-containing protein [Paenalkalicoccus suaedae]QKS71981.1 DUF2507 domain-containing protein [Paenalkalicoccus suaedae]